MRVGLFLLGSTAFASVLGVLGAAEGATLRVDPAGGGDFTAIQPALDAAAAGDIVLVAAGEYVISGPLSFNRLHDPGNPASPSLKNLALRSEAGPTETTIRIASPADPERASVFVFEKGEDRTSTLAGFRLTGGTGTRYGSEITEKGGGGIYCAGGSSPTLRDLTIFGNTAPLGGGLYCDEGSSPNVTSSTITGNMAENGGGVYTFRGSLRLANTVVARNFATYGGGVFSFFASPAVVHCTVTGNASRSGPGGVYFDGADAGTIRSSILWGNAGGSLSGTRFTPPLEVSYSCVEGPQAWPGAGNINLDPLFCGWGTREEVFVDPSYPYRGQGTSSIPFSDLIHAAGFNFGLASGSPCIGAGEGGSTMGAERDPCEAPGTPVRRLRLAAGTYDVGILTFGSARVEMEGAGAVQSIIRGTIAGLRQGDRISKLSVTGGAAGGILMSAGESADIEDCALVRNDGVGLICSEGASPRVARCAISENRDRGIYCGPGAAPTFEDCTITANVADGPGAGCLVSAGSPRFTRCLFAENVGTSAIEVVEEGTLTLLECTVTANAGHGIARYGSTVSITGSIVWGNLGRPLTGYDGPVPTVVEFSCLDPQEIEVFPGEGNIDADPLFCGHDGRGEVFVDATAPGPGDGSAAAPYPNFAWARGHSFALAAGSPCRGNGKDGSDMGALRDSCDQPGEPFRLVHVAAGEYGRVPNSVFLAGAALEGAGPDLTSLEGPVTGLRAGARLSGVTVSGWKSVTLAAIHVSFTRGEPPSVADCRVTGNRADGIQVEYGWVGRGPTFLRCEARRNAGNGAYASLAAFIECSFTENGGDGVRPRGINDPDSTRLVRCRIAGNGGWGVATDDGSNVNAEACEIVGNARGGLLLSYSSANLLNCLVAGNGGDGIHGAFKSFPERVANCTIAANAGDGMLCSFGTPDILNCIAWRNGGQRTLCSRSPGPNLTDQDPRFVHPGVFDFTRFTEVEIMGQTVSLPDFIVEAPDFHLRPGSPAIDTGSPDGAPAEDIEGNARPCGAGVDIGAHESGGCEPPGAPFRRGDANADGLTNLPDAIFSLRYLFTGGEPPPCGDSADIDDSGSLEITDPISFLFYLFVGSTSPRLPFPDCGLDPTIDTMACEQFAACN